jgi:hypothetical protein
MAADEKWSRTVTNAFGNAKPRRGESAFNPAQPTMLEIKKGAGNPVHTLK